MRILYLTRHIDRSETELFCTLAESGHSVALACHPATRNLDRVRKSPIALSHFEFNRRIQPSAVLFLSRLIRDFNPDLIHALDSKALASALFATVFRNRSVPIVAYRGTVGNISIWDPGARIAHLHPRISRIICVSEAVREFLLGIGVPESRAVTIHKGHRIEWYQNLPGGSLTDCGIPEGAFVVGSAANDRPHKGLHVLIDAVHRISNPRVHLVIAGKDPEGRLAALARGGASAARIHLLGYREDAAHLMGEASVFVMPSTAREGLARSVVEALAQGVPVIVTTVGGLPEMIEEGREGFIVPPSDPVTLAERIQTLVRDTALRQSMQNAAQERVRTFLSIEKTIAATLRLYGDLLNPAHSVLRNR